MLRRTRIPALLLLAALAPACDTAVNEGSVAVLVTVRASLGDNNQQGNGDVLTDSIGISADGRYVVFASKATNLVPNDTNLAADVFLRDTVNRTTTLISINIAGTGTGNGESSYPSISADGRYVAFQSAASDISVDDGDTIRDIFVRDTQTDTTILVSRASGPLGAKGTMDSTNPMISATGRFVVFDTLANELDGAPAGGPDNDATSDVYRRDVLDPTAAFPTELVSVATGPSSGGGVVKGDGASLRPSISSDGRFVAYESVATNLAPLIIDGGPDANGVSDCFLRDIQTERNQRFSLATVGGTIDPDGPSVRPYISSDGFFITYRSTASNLVPEDDGPEPDVYIYDVAAALTVIGSVHSSGAQAGSSCNFPSLSADGQIVVFQSASSSLVNGDGNSTTDCFSRGVQSLTTRRVSVATFGTELNGQSLRPVISGDGKYVAFVSEATNIADDDTNGATDLFLRGPPR